MTALAFAPETVSIISQFRRPTVKLLIEDSASYANIRIIDRTGLQSLRSGPQCKNWLFSDQPVGAHTSAIIYSLVQTAKLNGVNPYYYLRYVLEKMSSYPNCKNLPEQDLQDLMPWSDKLKEAVQCYEKEKDRTA